MKANLSKAAGLLAAPLAQTARLLGALQTAAEDNPALLAGVGAPPEAEAADAATEAAETVSEAEASPADTATDAAPAAESTPAAADAATEE
jgi:large subunit ribosomal protein L10